MPVNTDRLIGSTIAGKYRLDRLIARGAFGYVFAAEQLYLGRTVMLKIAFSPDPEFTERFRKEQAALAQLKSAHIAQFFDSGTLDDGSAFLVTEFVDGTSLDHILKQRGTLSLDEALEICEQVAEALDEAHRMHILHRDLKPANVMITTDGRAILVDFGVAGALDLDTGATQFGQVFGTPNYMAPEQVLGDSQTPATDVYALGVLLYQMLTGESLYKADNIAVLAAKIVTEDAHLPSGELPAPVTAFLRRCLAKNHTTRPADGSAALMLIRKLRATVSSDDMRTVIARAPSIDASAGATAPALYSQHPWSLAAGIAIVILGLTVGVVLILGRSSYQLQTAALGLTLILAGAIFGAMLHHALSRKQHALSIEAGNVLGGAKTRDVLNKTLAIEVNELIEKVHRLDERIMARTVALMLHEYQSAEQAGDRHNALLKSADLLERLIDRMTPWYVRYEKLLVFFVTATGLVSGLLSLGRSLSIFGTG